MLRLFSAISESFLSILWSFRICVTTHYVCFAPQSGHSSVRMALQTLGSLSTTATIFLWFSMEANSACPAMFSPLVTFVSEHEAVGFDLCQPGVCFALIGALHHLLARPIAGCPLCAKKGAHAPEQKSSIFDHLVGAAKTRQPHC